MVTHEKAYCPKNETVLKKQGDHTGVFARVQLPLTDVSRSFRFEIRSYMINMIDMVVTIMTRSVITIPHCQGKGGTRMVS